MKKNNNSKKFSDWTTAKLKKECEIYDDLIYGPNACYGVRDMITLTGIINELEKRGIEVGSQVTFN